tara:strand:+ start:329 stop:448 length:120 start_codon:yes stop_codon:yes gene_type:complete
MKEILKYALLVKRRSIMIRRTNEVLKLIASDVLVERYLL